MDFRVSSDGSIKCCLLWKPAFHGERQELEGGQPNLANLRKSPRFKPLLNKYDEPIINEAIGAEEAAVEAFKNLFSWGQKKDD